MTAANRPEGESGKLDYFELASRLTQQAHDKGQYEMADKDTYTDPRKRRSERNRLGSG